MTPSFDYNPMEMTALIFAIAATLAPTTIALCQPPPSRVPFGAKGSLPADRLGNQYRRYRRGCACLFAIPCVRNACALHPRGL